VVRTAAFPRGRPSISTLRCESISRVVEVSVKNPCFLWFPVLWAVGDSSAGSLFIQGNKKSEASHEALKYYPWLLLASAAMVVPLVWAEWDELWAMAQASLVTLLLLLALAIWCWWQAQEKTPDLSIEAAIYHRALEKLLWCVAIGILAMITVATRTEHWTHGIVGRAIGYGILISGFSFISGVLLGYLFGLRPTDNSQQSGDRPLGIHPQTNLAEIADWLTKIILGAGLVQLTRMPTPIWNFAINMAQGVVAGTREPANPAMALAVMGFFSTCGLLYGYLWTRYEDALTSNAAGDASALALVDRWLNGRIAPDDQTRSDLIDAIKSASSAAKMRIFLQADQYRMLSTEDVNERSLPVFQALVEADPEGIFHRSRGQYALALMGRKKDPKKPDDDWRIALDVLNDAVRIRDSSREPGWHDYAFARAVCEIILDPNFRNGQSSDAQTAQWIRADLDRAADVPEATKNLIDRGQVVPKWEGLAAKKAA
jgi:hypothetical protein